MKADIVLENVVVVIEIDGECYDIALENKEYVYADQMYDSPEEYLERVSECARDLERVLGYPVGIYTYSSQNEEE